MADGWFWVIGFYSLQAIALAVIIVLSVLFWDKRYKRRKSKEIPQGYIRTEEVSIDPGTNKKTRVYYHPGTGDRIYVSEE